MNDFELKKAQILDRVDIVEVVSEHVALKRSGKRWVGLCPFHSEKTASFTVNPDLRIFKCFGCGKGGDVFSFVQTRENVSFVEAMRILADRAGVDLGGANSSASSGPDRSDLAKVNAWAVRFFRANLLHETIGRSTREYLTRRQISEPMSERFSLGLATEGTPSLVQTASRAGLAMSSLLAADLVREGDGGRTYETFRRRLVFPIRDTTKRVIGFGGRTLADDRAKYLNTRQNPLFDKGRVLYGLDLARGAISESRWAIVVEGYTDCLAAHQAGFANTVATLGTALTESHVDLLRRYCDEIVILFDSDDAGEAASDRAIRVALPRCITVRMARIPTGKDPSEFLIQAGSEAFSDVLKQAVDALEFKWRQTLRRFGGATSAATRRDAILDFVGIVAEAAETGAVDEIQRGLLANQVAHLLGIDGREVHRLLARRQKRLAARTQASTPRVKESSTTPPRNAEQAAWTTLLEVVLNAPALVRTTKNMPDPRRVSDECERRIALIVFSLAEESDQAGVSDLLARCDAPEDVERAAELARRGAQRGNYEKTFRVALERIGRASEIQGGDSGKRGDAGGKPAAVEDNQDRLANVQQHMRKHRHYVPQRLIRQSMTGAEFTAREEAQASTAEQQ